MRKIDITDEVAGLVMTRSIQRRGNNVHGKGCLDSIEKKRETEALALALCRFAIENWSEFGADNDSLRYLLHGGTSLFDTSWTVFYLDEWQELAAGTTLADEPDLRFNLMTCFLKFPEVSDRYLHEIMEMSGLDNRHDTLRSALYEAVMLDDASFSLAKTARILVAKHVAAHDIPMRNEARRKSLKKLAKSVLKSKGS